MITRRDFSLITAATAIGRGHDSTGAGRRHAQRRPRLRAPEHAGAGARRRQDRGHRVLLLRLPALLHVRADARAVGQAAAGRRGLPPRSGAFNAPFEGYARLFYALEAIGLVETLHSASSPRSMCNANGWTRRPTSPPSSVPTAATAPSSSRPASPLGGHQVAPSQAGGGRLQDRRRADHGHPRPLVHLGFTRRRQRQGAGGGRLPDPARPQSAPEFAPSARRARRISLARPVSRRRLVARMACKFCAAMKFRPIC